MIPPRASAYHLGRIPKTTPTPEPKKLPGPEEDRVAMDCPRCSVEMTEIAGEDSLLQRCSDCGGLWLDVADVNRFLLHANLPALTRIGGFLNPEEMAGQCPACQVDLVAVEGGEKRSLHYDTCESCGGIWVEGPDEGDVPEASDWKTSEREVVAFYKRFAKK